MRSKIKTLTELKQIVEMSRKQGRKIVFTNGCFDLLHVGHVRYLQEAKSFGDLLVVAVNSDDSVRRNKGKGRPIIPAEERSEVIAALGCVDYVVIFHETLPTKVINILRPDVHVKGGDYSVDELPEEEVVRSYGGTVAIVREVEDHSTSDLIERVKAL